MSAKKTNPVNAHLAAAREAAGDAVQQLKAAISAATDDQRPLLQEALDDLQDAIDHMDWMRPRFARAVRLGVDNDAGEVRPVSGPAEACRARAIRAQATRAPMGK
jgi:hypothetical protein